jgi:phospholipase/carboxylesterase
MKISRKPLEARRMLLTGLAVLFLAAPVLGQTPFTEVVIDNHSCLVSDPIDLPTGAPVVLMLHGLGGNRGDLLGVCRALHLPPCRIVLPDAPLVLPGYDPGHFAWYDLKTHDRTDIENSRDYLFEIMDHFARDSSSPRPVILVGFSQGGLMALEAGLNYKGPILAMVSMSGYIWDEGQTLANRSAPLTTPILLVHGTNDSIIGESLTMKTLEALRQAGYHPVLKEFKMGHAITRESIKAVSEFLQKVLKGP